MLSNSTDTTSPFSFQAVSSAVVGFNSSAPDVPVDHHVAVIDLLTRMLNSNRVENARRLAAYLIAEYLQADFVAIGEHGPSPTPCQLAIIAGHDRPSEEHRNDLEAALGECVVTARSHRVDWDIQRQSLAGFAHQRFAARIGNKSLLTIPLTTSDGNCCGALMVAWPTKPSGVGHERFLSLLALPLAELLVMLQRATPGRLAKRWSVVREFFSPRRRYIGSGITLVVILIGLIPIRFPVRAEVTIEPTVRRWIVAPFDAPLKHSHVLPGQTVEIGDVLLSVDCEDTLNKLASLRAEGERAVAERSSHLSAGRLSEASLAGLNAKRIRSEIDLLTKHLDRAEIRSPIDGTVLGEDLKRLEGSPLKLGQTLLEVAQTEQMRAVIEIPTDQILRVAKGSDVSVSVDAAGSLPTLTLSRIHPRAEPNEQGTYVFTGYADLPGSNPQWMPGMRGQATIHGQYRPAAWCLFQRLWQRLKNWS